MISKFWFLLLVCLYSSSANAQSFPIVPLIEPVYPADQPLLSEFQWLDADGTLNRRGDINNDEIDDLIVLFLGPGIYQMPETRSLWVFTRNADGTFNPPYYIDGFPLLGYGFLQDMAVNDFDDDGRDDILLLTGVGQYLHVWLNTVNGFERAPILDLGISISPDNISRLNIEDYTGDGLDDYIIWNSMKQIWLWRSMPDGSFASQMLWDDPGSSHFGMDIISTDIDGDADPDILASINYDELVWFENIGDSYLPRELDDGIIDSPNLSSEHAIIGDFNADGLTDLMFRADAQGVDGFAFYLAPFDLDELRDVPFVALPEVAPIPEGFSRKDQARTPGDLDGDGTDDVVFLPDDEHRRGWIMTDPMNINGRRAFGRTPDLHGTGSFSPKQYDYDEKYAYREICFDVNGDRVDDRIHVTTTRKYVDLDDSEPDPNGIMLWASLTNCFDTEYLEDQRDVVFVPRSSHLIEVDQDLDGVPELINTQGYLSNRLNSLGRDSDGYLVMLLSNYPSNIAGFRTQLAQIDADSRPDLVSLAYGQQSPFPAIFVNPDPGSPTTSAQNTPLAFDGKQALEDAQIEFYAEGSSFVVADINGDSLDDIVMRGDDRDPARGPRVVLPWINEGDGTFSIGSMFEVGSSEAEPTTFLWALDEDHDGDIDIISFAGDPDFTWIEIYHNIGDGSFVYNRMIDVHSYDRIDPFWVTSEDTDLDGYEDLVIVLTDQRDTSEVMIVYGSKNGLEFDPTYLQGRGAAEAIVADVNFDGLPDIVTCAYNTWIPRQHSLTVMLQSEGRIFQPAVSISDQNFSTLIWFDVDLDGAKDLLAADADTSYSTHYRSLPAPCLPDLNLDKQLNFYDISLFIELFLAQRPLVDFNRDGSHNFFDVSAMIESYLQGCP